MSHQTIPASASHFSLVSLQAELLQETGQEAVTHASPLCSYFNITYVEQFRKVDPAIPASLANAPPSPSHPPSLSPSPLPSPVLPCI